MRILLTILFTLLNVPIYNVPDDYMSDVYRVADIKLEELLDEEVVEEEIIEEVVSDEIIEENPEEDIADIGTMDLDNDPLLQELIKNNQNWDLFLDSYPVTESFNVSPTISVSMPLNISSSGVLNSNNSFMIYVPVSINDYLSYNINYNGTTSRTIRCFVTNVLDLTGSVSFFRNDTGSDFNISGNLNVASDGFFCMVVSSTSNLTSQFIADFNITRTHYDSYTLSELGNSLQNVSDKVDALTEHIDLNVYDTPEALEAADMYVNKYQYETFKLLRYLVILLACLVGSNLIMIFTWRSRNGNT